MSFQNKNFNQKCPIISAKKHNGIEMYKYVRARNRK